MYVLAAGSLFLCLYGLFKPRGCLFGLLRVSQSLSSPESRRGAFVYFSVLETTAEVSAVRKVVLSMKTFRESVLFCVGHSVEFLVATWNCHWAFNWLPWVCCR